MKITFLGAAGEVTGSCYLVETSRARVLLDCGMFQGSITAEVKNRRPLPFDHAKLDAVVLTHAHLDHSGRLPRLVTDGYHGRIFTTPVSITLTDILLRDAAHLQTADVERLCRKRRDCGRPDTGRSGPLFDDADVTATVRQLAPIPYMEQREVAPGVRIRFFDAGHILGSSSVEMTIDDNGKQRVIVFSGDIGERGTPILSDPVTPPRADVVVLESTYGDGDHKPLGPTLEELRRVVDAAQRTGGKVLIPAFAVGRTQTLLYHLAGMQREGLLTMPVYLDSPMGIAVTQLYAQHRELFDEEAKAFLPAVPAKLAAPTILANLHISQTGADSKALNNLAGPAIIIAGAGMCTGGRIVHHLKQRLGDPLTHVVMAGYQSEGTLGRRLVDGQKQVRILGSFVDVRATIHTLGGFSAHAGQTGLLEWASVLAPTKPRLFLTHGEIGPREILAAALQEKFAWPSTRPLLGDSADLG